MNFDTLFQQPNALPAAPKIVQDLIASFGDEDVLAHDIARKLAADPVLSAKLLRLANSAFYQVARSVSTVNDAVMMLGFSTVRTVVISSGMIDGFKSTPGMDLKRFWRVSLHAAVAAKWLAKQVDGDTELAFTIGMMHGIGQLVLHVGIPEQTRLLDAAVSPLDAKRFDAEREALGYDYAEVGAELALRWKFPDAFADTLRAFPRPLQQQPFEPLPAIIYLAAWFARSHENGLSKDEIRTNTPTEVAEKLGLEPYLLSDAMPPLAELSDGLESLVN
jgi:HD-like signal output (HDOD) protein